jgi:hypothetical protein
MNESTASVKLDGDTIPLAALLPAPPPLPGAQSAQEQPDGAPPGMPPGVEINVSTQDAHVVLQLSRPVDLIVMLGKDARHLADVIRRAGHAADAGKKLKKRGR